VAGFSLRGDLGERMGVTHFLEHSVHGLSPPPAAATVLKSEELPGPTESPLRQRRQSEGVEGRHRG
jgi:hypothetical protein